MAIQQVAEVGYGDPGARTYIEKFLEEHNTGVVADVRISTESRYKPEWNLNALNDRYGKKRYGKQRYIWLPELGNKNRFIDDAPMEIARPEEGAKRLFAGIDKGYLPLLMCACKEYESCHRCMVVEMLQEQRPELQLIRYVPPLTALQTILCLSIRQPWAWLIAMALKDIENRNWRRNFALPRWILIHTGSRVEENYFYESGELSPYFKQTYGPALAAEMPQHLRGYTTGAIIGIARMVDIVSASTSPWFCGEYGFVFEQARLFEKPIPYRGQQGFFEVERSVVESQLRKDEG